MDLQRGNSVQSRRITWIFALFALVWVVIALRMGQFQILEHEESERTARDNTTTMIHAPLVRNDVVDRNGTILAVDRPKFRVVKISRAGELETTELDLERASRLLESGRLPRGYVEAMPERHYPFGATMSHAIGYLGEIDAKEYRKLRGRGYIYGDRVGKAGVERWHETEIAGRRGTRAVTTDARGRLLPETKTTESMKGKPLRLTIDIRLQQAAMEALAGRNGAVVFMDPRNGAVRVMASSPGYDPQLLSGRLNSHIWKNVIGHPDHPLLNRASASAAPPGSIFKLVVATAALEEGVVSPDSHFSCGGSYSLGRKVFGCWRAHGGIDFLHGISMSCDVVFYQLARKLGVEKIKKYSRMFGLGGKTGIDVPGESIGLIPDTEWKRRFRKAGWYEGDTVNVGIGQGYVQVTPVQAAAMVSALAGRGRWVRPHLVGEEVVERRNLPVKMSAIDFVRKGMRTAVESGTAVRLAQLPVACTGKTGTAQDPPRVSHAWFVGFAPYDKPVLAWAVFVENGGMGSGVALPVAKAVLEKAVEIGYFPDVKKTAPAKQAKAGGAAVNN